jgi:predicted nucleic acid-binding protein
LIALDAGFLLALLDADDAWHERAKRQVGTAEEGWITIWPVLAEACYLLLRQLGPTAAAGLVADVADGGLAVWPIPPERHVDIAVPMRKYSRQPMDLADASLVLLAEHLGHGRVLSTDARDFSAYRWSGRKPFHNLLESEK